MKREIYIMQEKLEHLFNEEKVNYKNIYKVKSELDRLIEKYYFENL